MSNRFLDVKTLRSNQKHSSFLKESNKTVSSPKWTNKPESKGNGTGDDATHLGPS
jgi:hypothetical protein